MLDSADDEPVAANKENAPARPAGAAAAAQRAELPSAAAAQRDEHVFAAKLAKPHVALVGMRFFRDVGRVMSRRRRPV